MAHEIVLYNTLTRKKDTFKPLDANKIRMYVCGMTVYDDCHMGHARSMVSFDVWVRFLKSVGYDVTFVRNITDVDDKIIKRAQERGVSIEDITHRYIASMHDDMKALHLLPPSIEPKATDHIPEMIQLIETLIADEYAYLSSDGDVCFDLHRYKNYGALSNKNIEDLMAGIHTQDAAGKRSPLDFVLWKKTKAGEPSWPSPWGEGRPGWHIECSAMAMKELGETFDIHGGGLDLQFPHHENEIAQSECATGKKFANYWLHTGMLQVNQEKMSKSLGNFFTIKDVLQEVHPEVLRYFLTSAHYRSPLNYNEEHLQLAEKALMRLYQSLMVTIDESEHDKTDPKWVARFQDVMADDLNTPEALAVLFDLSHELNKNPSRLLKNTLIYLGNILGLLFQTPVQFLQSGTLDMTHDMIQQKIDERLRAKKEKNWALADAIRDELLAIGISLLDTPTGTTWRKG